jgi:hypothetical protein
MMSEFDRRSAAIDGAPPGPPGSNPETGRRGAEATAREELLEHRRQLLGVRVLERDDLGLLLHARHVHALQDLEDAPDIGGGVGDDEEIGALVRVERALLRHEGAQEAHGLGGVEELQRHDLGQHLVARNAGRLAPDHRADGRLRGALAGNDPVDIARLHRGEPVDVKDRHQQREHLVAPDPADGLQRHLPAAYVGRQHVVEAGGLRHRLDDDLDVRVVEVERHLAPPRGRRGGGRCRWGRRRGRRLRGLGLRARHRLDRDDGWGRRLRRRPGRGIFRRHPDAGR